MSAPKVGDRVRVVLEGPVQYVDGDGKFFNVGGNPRLGTLISTVDHRDSHVVSVEILPRPLKVGDTLARGQYEAAPTGTVVRNRFGDRHTFIRCQNGRWLCSDGHAYDPLGLIDERTVVYVPEASS